ncbi:MAG: AarF/ABC1/UbiB kinase family protein, partial [Anaerolineae bacterium]|nr:AarF/ABC1/UbiB kinase family protein [Anaerolineae bacterium]
FQVPQDLILLGRAMAILSGMCTGLDPQFNLWESVAPFAQKLIAEEAVSDWRFWLDELGELARALLTMPRRLDSVLGTMERGELAVQVPQLVERVDRLERAIRRAATTVIFAALLTAGVQLYLADHVLPASILLAAAALALAWAIFSR